MSASTKVLAFYSPYPRAGKTTAADFLAFGDRLFPKNSPVKMSFADPMREMVAALFAEVGLCLEECEREGKDVPRPELKGATPRDLLVCVGQSVRNRFGSDFWAHVMHHAIQSMGAQNVIIDDLRFYEEYRMLQALGAKTVRITVPGRVPVYGETEAQLEGLRFDAEIVNTLDDPEVFRAEVESVYDALMGEENR